MQDAMPRAAQRIEAETSAEVLRHLTRQANDELECLPVEVQRVSVGNGGGVMRRKDLRSKTPKQRMSVREGTWWRQDITKTSRLRGAEDE
jgi:hypothetical protein